MGLVDLALQALQSIARPANQKSKAQKGQPVDEQHVQHARINRSASAHDRLRVLGAEEPDREVNKRDAERAQNRQGGRQCGCLSAGRETAEHEVAYVDQPQYQRRRKSYISGGPPNAPHWPRPDRSGDQNDGTEDDADFSTDQRDDVGRRVPPNKIQNRRYKINEEQSERSPSRRNVIVKNPLHVAHRLLGGCSDQRLVKRVAQQDRGKNTEDGEGSLHAG